MAIHDLLVHLAGDGIRCCGSVRASCQRAADSAQAKDESEADSASHARGRGVGAHLEVEVCRCSAGCENQSDYVAVSEQYRALELLVERDGAEVVKWLVGMGGSDQQFD